MSWRTSVHVSIAAILVLHGGVPQQLAAENRPSSFSPNKEAQALLSGLISPNEQQLLSGTEEQFRSKLTQLKNMAHGDVENLVPELLYFSTQAKGMREAMLAGVIIKELKITKENIANGVLPYLDSPDGKMRKQSHNWLGEVDAGRSGKEPDFGVYESIIRKRKGDVPKGLVRYMYAKSPESALSTMASIYLTRDRAEALMNEAGALETLSKRSEWWVNLYVAETMKRNPKLRSSVALEHLKKSEHPLVQEAIKEIGKADKK